MILDACAAEKDCAAAFPKLREELAVVLARLDRELVRVEMTWAGEKQEVVVDRGIFATDLRFLLYSPNGAMRVPAIIHLAAQGDFAALLQAGLPFRRGVLASIYLGMHLSVTCAEDVPYFDYAEADKLAAGTFLGDSRIRQQKAACELWPRGPIPDDFHDPVEVDVPTLLVVGDLDPVTPPKWAEEVASHLPESKVIVSR